MRIFLSSQQSLRPHAVPGYTFWEFYFKQGITEAGHEVLATPRVDWAEGLTPLNPEARACWLGETWTRTIEFIRAEHARKPIDLFLSYLFPDQVEPVAVADIQALGIPCVNFFCDNVREFTRVPHNFRGFDLHWVPEADARSLYRAAGFPFIYAPMPMWVPPELRVVPKKENRDITFIGSRDILREDLLSEAVARGLLLRLYGDGWLPGDPAAKPSPRAFGKTLANQLAFLRTHGLQGFAKRGTYQLHRLRPKDWIAQSWQPLVEREKYFRATRESQVVLGINRYPSFHHSFSKPGRYSRLRDVEAPMLGTCYLTEKAPGLEDLYDLGTEIEIYSNTNELLEKVAQLQRDPKRRANLRRLGQRRALAEHTIARSLSRIFGQLGLAA